MLSFSVSISLNVPLPRMAVPVERTWCAEIITVHRENLHESFYLVSKPRGKQNMAVNTNRKPIHGIDELVYMKHHDVES